MSNQSAARQYANALFTVADRNQRVAAVGGDLSAFAAVVAAHDELRRFFESPLVLPRKKREVIEALVAAADGMADEVHRLLTMLAERDRLDVLEDINRAFHDRLMTASQAIEADVTTAMPMSDDSLGALGEALGRATGRKVTVQGSVDPEIVGGLVARVGSLVFDGSLAGQLRRMRQRIAAGV